MLVATSDIITQKPPEEIWKIICDIKGHDKWNEAIRWVKYKYPIAKKGTQGKMRLKVGGKVRFKVTQLFNNQALWIKCNLAFASITFEYIIRNNKNKNQLTYSIYINGVLDFIYAFAIGRRLRREIDKTTRNVKKLGEL